MDGLRSDLRVSLRSLARSRGFALLCASTVALVICGVTSITSIVSGALLDPGPYRQPDRVVGVQLMASNLPYGRLYFPFDDFVSLERATTGAGRVFADLTAYGVVYAMMTGGPEPVDLIAGVMHGRTLACSAYRRCWDAH